MPDAHKNFAYSLVATAPSPASSGTSLVVTAADGALFPAVPFNATVWPTAAQPLSTTAEIVRVTARSTDTLTITRAQEGTAARTIVVGDQIAATISAKTLTDAETETSTIWNAAGDLAVGTGADTAAALTKGTPGQVLLPDGSTLAWVAQPMLFDLPTGAISHTIARTGGANFGNLSGGAALVGGTLRVVGIWLPKGATITSVTWVSGTTAAATNAHAWTSLHDSSLNLLRQSTDDTSLVWAANSVHTFTLSSTFVTTYAGLHYLGLLVQGGTIPTLTGYSATTANVNSIAPIMNGTSSTGLTATAPNPGAALTSNLGVPYAYVS